MRSCPSILNSASRAARGFAILCAVALVWTAVAVSGGSGVRSIVGPRSGAEHREILTGCRLLAGKYHDGDSFHVLHGGREFVFRLYSVDCPETDHSVPNQVLEQARDLRIGTDDVNRLGREATRFTEAILNRPFTVSTRHDPALGRKGRIAREYAVVSIEGRDLAEELVRHGLARIHGRRPPWLSATGRKELQSSLQRAEREARHRKQGVHDPAHYARGPRARETVHARPRDPSIPVNVNTATALELESLPGIGPKIAQRIIAARPLHSLAALRRIEGIGPQTFADLTNRIVLGTLRPAKR